MGRKKSKTSFRINGLNAGQTASFDATLRAWSHSQAEVPSSSVALSKETGPANYTATASCAVESHKKRFIRKSEKFASAGEPWVGAAIDDNLSGITMLHSPPNAQIDICFVHGLNGNSMDTFAKANHNGNEMVVWPRDILPTRPELAQARIMTYDYNSRVFDNVDVNDDPREWANDLLLQIEHVREVGMRDNRRIIFIAHSLGGLVVRFAAQELFEKRNNNTYGTLCIRDCGFLFLATPHRGSTQADFGPIRLALVHPFIGWRGRRIIRRLSTKLDAQLANNEIVWGDIEAYSQRPVVCFSEGQQTKIPVVGYKTIVTHESARFRNHRVVRLETVDHKSICRVRNEYDGHFQVYILPAICEIQRSLVNQPPLAQALQIAAPPGPAPVPAQIQAQHPVLPPAQNLVQLPAHAPMPPIQPLPAIAPQTPGPPAIMIEAHLCFLDERAIAYRFSPSFNGHKTKNVLDLLDRIGIPNPSEKKPLTRSKPTIMVTPQLAPHREQKAGGSINPECSPLANGGLTPTADQFAMNQSHNGSPREPEQTESTAMAITQAATPETPIDEDEQGQEAWNQMAILTIDAGATRNFISLVLLRELMKEIGRLEELLEAPSLGLSRRPCDYFDYIAGVSTGGLLAIMLGHLRMNADQAILEFKEISERMFSPSRLISMNWFAKKRNNTRLFEALCKKTVNKYSNNEYFSSPPNKCKTIVTAVMRTTSHSVDVPSVFCSYRTKDNTTKSLPAWQVARATSAAPRIFKPMKIKGKNYVDGGVMSSNPSSEIFGEVFGQGQKVSLLVSLGTGVPTQSKEEFFKPGYFGVRVPVRNAKLLMGFSMDGQSVHKAMQGLMKSLETEYFRFNVPLDAKEWRLDSWTKSRKTAFDHLEQITNMHLKQADVKKSLQECAAVLVERRRLRSMDEARWRDFALT